MAAFSAGSPKESNPQRRQDGLAEHRLVADHEVAEGVVAHVALVGGARRVGVHAQGVEALTGVVVVDLVIALVEPARLPLLFNCRDIEWAGHHDILGKERPSLLWKAEAQ